VAGAFFASYICAIDPTSFTISVSIQVLIMVVLGGMASIRGVIVAATAVIVLPEVFRSLAEYRILAFATALIVIVMVRPGGPRPGTQAEAARGPAPRRRAYAPTGCYRAFGRSRTSGSSRASTAARTCSRAASAARAASRRQSGTRPSCCGRSAEAAAVAATFARRYGGATPLRAVAASATPSLAAFANAVAASALDIDDGHYGGGGIHAAAAIPPAVIATAETDAPVREALTAQVAGHEVALRAAHLLRANEGPIYQTTGTAAAVGAAIAAARIRRLDVDATQRALSIAWLHAPMATFGLPMVKESVGWAAHVGVAAAELAADGFMRMPGGGEPPRLVGGELASPFQLPGALDDPFVTSLGTIFESARTYFKPYPACRFTHSAIYGARTLAREHGITCEEIAEVRVGTHRGALFLACEPPRTLEHAQYSYAHVVAASLLGREMGELEDPANDELARRVAVVHDPDLDDEYPRRYPNRVTIRTSDGRVVGGTLLDAPGDPALSLPVDELQAKWERLLSTRLGPADVEQVLVRLGRPDERLAAALEPLFRRRRGARDDDRCRLKRQHGGGVRPRSQRGRPRRCRLEPHAREGGRGRRRRVSRSLARGCLRRERARRRRRSRVHGGP